MLISVTVLGSWLNRAQHLLSPFPFLSVFPLGNNVFLSATCRQVGVLYLFSALGRRIDTLQNPIIIIIISIIIIIIIEAVAMATLTAIMHAI